MDKIILTPAELGKLAVLMAVGFTFIGFVIGYCLTLIKDVFKLMGKEGTHDVEHSKTPAF